MDRVMEWLVKFLFLLMVAPFLLCLLLKLLTGVMLAVLPWLVFASVIAGLAAGASAAVVLRRRLPARRGPALPPTAGAVPRVRRPRGPRHDD